MEVSKKKRKMWQFPVIKTFDIFLEIILNSKLNRQSAQTWILLNYKFENANLLIVTFLKACLNKLKFQHLYSNFFV